MNTRQEALRVLQEVTEQGAYASLALRRRFAAWPATGSDADHKPQEDQERRFVTNLVYTTLRHLEEIDATIDRLSKVPVSKLNPLVLQALRLGICQLWYLEGVEEYAAIHETVNLVKRSKVSPLSGYVNGVLRTVQREGRSSQMEAALPEWIFRLWERDYGTVRAKKLQEAMITPKPLCLRLNSLVEDAEATFLRVQQETVGAVRRGNLAEEAVYLPEGKDVSSWDLYQEGYITVQDETSILASKLTGVRPGDQVLDLCAAPGGKSTMMAQLMLDQGVIVSRDVHPHRVELIRQNAGRLHVSVIQAEVGDGTLPQEKDRGAYDVVLLDAPCSGLGMLRSRPDIAMHRSEPDIRDLSALQERLLETAALAVKPGGRLVYSTCTLTKQENEDQVQHFLQTQGDFSLVDLKEHPLLQGLTEEEGRVEKALTLFPVPDGHEGFFVAVMQKT